MLFSVQKGRIFSYPRAEIQCKIFLLLCLFCNLYFTKWLPLKIFVKNSEKDYII